MSWYQDAMNFWSQQPSWAAQPTSNIAVVTTTPSIALISTQIVAANPNRKGFTIWNNSANSIYLTFGPTSSSGTPTFILPTFQSWVMVNGCIWTGAISGIRNAGSGTVTIYELV